MCQFSHLHHLSSFHVMIWLLLLSILCTRITLCNTKTTYANTSPVQEDEEICTQASLRQIQTKNETLKALLDEMWLTLAPKFPTLYMNGLKPTRCLESKPPWDSTCPGSAFLDLAEARIDSDQNYNKALEAIEKMAELIIAGKLNDDLKILSCPRIEHLIWKIAKKIMVPSAVEKPRPKRIKHILHVATELFNTGGHTKALVQFIDSDTSDRVHWFFRRGLACPSPLVCSRQEALARHLLPIPAERIFSCQPGDFGHCANFLRNLSTEADLVILHMHQHDTLPVLAYSSGYKGAPIAFFDHSDHTFWIGSSIIDARLCERQASFRLFPWRGLPQERNFQMYIPIGNPFLKRHRQRQGLGLGLGLGSTRAEARQELKLPDDKIILLSMAASYKFHPLLLELVMPILTSHPNVMYVAFGPEGWNQYSHNRVQKNQTLFAGSTSGGYTSYLYHIAADIHIDSFPFASLTSALETAKEGGVILSFCPWENEASMILCVEPDDYAASRTLFSCPSPDHFTSKLRSLVSDEKELRSLQAQSKQLMQLHDAHDWTDQMNKIYAQINHIPRRPDYLEDPYNP